MRVHTTEVNRKVRCRNGHFLGGEDNVVATENKESFVDDLVETLSSYTDPHNIEDCRKEF